MVYSLVSSSLQTFSLPTSLKKPLRSGTGRELMDLLLSWRPSLPCVSRGAGWLENCTDENMFASLLDGKDENMLNPPDMLDARDGNGAMGGRAVALRVRTQTGVASGAGDIEGKMGAGGELVGFLGDLSSV